MELLCRVIDNQPRGEAEIVITDLSRSRKCFGISALPDEELRWCLRNFAHDRSSPYPLNKDFPLAYELPKPKSQMYTKSVDGLRKRERPVEVQQ